MVVIFEVVRRLGIEELGEISDIAVEEWKNTNDYTDVFYALDKDYADIFCEIQIDVENGSDDTDVNLEIENYMRKHGYEDFEYEIKRR